MSVIGADQLRLLGLLDQPDVVIITEFHMGDIVNLRTLRKRANRQKASERAAENRIVHGVPKAQRASNDALRDKAQHDLDRHQIDKGEGR